MRVQDHATDVASEAAKEFFRYAKAVSADKLTWSPLESGRTPISLCQEIAICPTWGEHLLGPAEFGCGDGEFEEQGKLMASWDTVEKCEEQFFQRFKSYEQVARRLTDEDLKKTKFLPFAGGRNWTYLEMIEYVRWNTTYHLGQIAYIQTLYGDKELY
jgi:hypothetical protein